MTNGISRRRFAAGGAAAALMVRLGMSPAEAADADVPVVYHAPHSTPEAMIALFDQLCRDRGITCFDRLCGIKLHGDEVSKNRHMWEALRRHIPASRYVECNYASEYASSRRGHTAGNRQAIINQGVPSEAIDILDRDKRYRDVPVAGAQELKSISTPAALLDEYGLVVVAANFKIPSFAGFSGAVKNVGVGLAGAYGKSAVHGPGFGRDAGFYARLADAAKGIHEAMSGRLLYLNVMTDMNPQPLEGASVRRGDLGILASTDMTAVDQAAVTMAYGLEADACNGMPEDVRLDRGFIVFENLERIGCGNRRYRLVTV